MSAVAGYRPSNGTEGDIFRAATCDRCAADHEWHLPPDYEGETSCPIILDALAGAHSYPNPDGPPQWSHDYETGESTCSEFQPCSCAEPTS